MSGKVVLVGYHQGAARQIPLGYWNWMAFQIVNGHFREVSTIMRGMTIGLRLLRSGAVTMDTLVTHRFGLEQIGEAFRDGIPVIMNLTEMADGDAKRLVDFAAGLIFGLRGSIEKVTNKVFLLSPSNVRVSAEDKRLIAEGGFYNQS